MTKKLIVLKLRFYSDEKDKQIKTILGPDRLYFYGENINIQKNTKSISITMLEPIE